MGPWAQNRGTEGGYPMGPWAKKSRWRHLGDFWARLESFRGALGASGRRLVGLLEASWRHLGASWERLGSSWRPLGAVWRRLGASCWPVGASWERLGRVLGRLGDGCRVFK